MERNWDTIRELLLKVEECNLTEHPIKLVDFPEERATEISYHMRLLIDAGLVKGSMVETLSLKPKSFSARCLTWEGHEFLDSIRSSSVWEKTKKTFLDKGIGMTFDLVKTGATQIAKELLGVFS